MVTLRLAQMSDCRMVWEWVNDPDVRKMSFNTDEINWNDHLTWFTKKINSDGSIYLIACEQEQEIGQIRFDIDIEHKTALVHIMIAKAFRGMGRGKEIMKEGIKFLKSLQPIVRIDAFVLAKNPGSQKMFESVGFRLVHESNTGQSQALKYELALTSGEATR